MQKRGKERGSRSTETCDSLAPLLGRRLLSVLFVALLFGGLLPSTSLAASIGVNFNSSTAAQVDLVTGTAGAVAQANWNNTSNNTGTISSGTVIDNSGSIVGGMLVSWNALTAFSVGSAAGTDEGDDTALMHGGLETHSETYSGNFCEISLTNIPYARYDLYLYVNGWNSSERDGEAQLVDDGAQTGRQPQFDVMGVDFVDGTHSHSESTGATDEGTYVLWENVTFADATIQIRRTGSASPMITGLQIVEVAVPDISDRNIGVNFNSNTAAAVDPVTGTAGAVPQTNWNNVSNNTGSVAGSVLEDSGATLEGMSVSWSGDAAWSVGGAVATGEDDDTALMHGGLETHDITYTGDNEITLTGIPCARYDLYMYVNGYSTDDRDGEAQLVIGGSVVSASQRQFDVMGVDFEDGTHSHSESTGYTDEGTYVLWENLTSANVTIQVLRTGAQGPMTVGLQIVEVAEPDILDQRIGVNFNSNTAAAVDPVSGTAGAAPQSNWNNVSNSTGTVAGSLLEDSGSTLEGMSVSWSGDAAWSVGGAVATGEGDDTALMHGGLETHDTTYTGDNEITLTGIPCARYDLYMYVNGYSTDDRDGEAQLVIGGSVVSASQRQFDVMGVDFEDGTHSHSESTGYTDEGTYVLWENLTSANVTIQVLRTGAQGPMTVGLQIVEVAEPDILDQRIGVNFNSNTAAAVDPVSGTAGAAPQSNWNNVSNSTGTVAGSLLEDSGSTLEGMSVSWSGDAAWSVGGAVATGEGDDTALMHGGLETHDTTYTGDTEISLTNVPYSTYDLYLYVNGWGAGDRDGEAQLEVGGSVVSGSQRAFDVMGVDFNDSIHSHNESTGADDEGTYVLWQDLTSADLTIQVKKTGANSPFIVGLQVVTPFPQGSLFLFR